MIRFLKSLQGKLFCSVGLGVAVLVVIAVQAVMSMNQVVLRYERLSGNAYHVKSEVDALNVEFKRQVQEWKNLLIRGSHEAAQADKYWQALSESHERIQARAKTLLGELPSGETRTRVESFARSHSALLAQYRRGKDAFVQSGYDIAAGDKAVSGIDRAPSQAMTELSEFISGRTDEVVRALAEEAGQTVWLATTTLLAASLVLLAVLLWVIRRQFLLPLHAIVAHIRLIAGGDFTRELNLKREDELGQLGQDLEQMKEDLGGLIAGIRTTADALEHAAGDLNRSSSAINEATAETESCSGQVAAAITEMAQTVNEVASSAAGANEATQTADISAQEGLAVMTNALQALNGVVSEISGVAEDVTRLEQSTASVGAVLDVIKGIAEQTNLLALNAAIEAARAGEQGRGFAVVADEVRALARRTQESTEEIQQIIAAVQADAGSVTQAMQSGRETTIAAVRLAGEAGQFIEAIADSVAEVRDMNQHIAAASEEQSVAADEISRNVVTMAELAENARAASGETHRVTVGLGQTARDLASLVGRFRVSFK